MTSKSCAFCNPSVLLRQTFYEDDLVLALYSHKPIFPGHCLIVPKRCINRFEELSDQEIIQVKRVIDKVDGAAQRVFGTCSYLFLQKNGVEVGQTEPHVHFHYIPRQEGDSSTFVFMVRMVFLSAMGPISAEEMQEVVGKMRKEMREDASCESRAM
ncbi:MAG: HIT family protein [Chlamydiota bacterium]